MSYDDIAKSLRRRVADLLDELEVVPDELEREKGHLLSSIRGNLRRLERELGLTWQPIGEAAKRVINNTGNADQSSE